MNGSKFFLTFFLIFFASLCQADFFDAFESEDIQGWTYFTGDGSIAMTFKQEKDYSRIYVDATKDQHNVWWATIKNDITRHLDLKTLSQSDFELRLEARVRVSHAPRRVNFMINTQRTRNYHKNLREFDIPNTTDWHVISMTTNNFDVLTSDQVFIQLCLTDFGTDQHHVDVDYVRAEVVNINSADPDQGEPLVYHPPVADISTYAHHVEVTQDALINPKYTDVNFNNWHVQERGRKTKVLTISGDHWAVLRWEFETTDSSKIDGPGILELTTQSVFDGGNYSATYGEDLGIEFSKVRIIEVFEGDEKWDQNTVTFNSLTQGQDYSDIFNTQMTYDAELTSEPGSKNYITISRPVLQRLYEGTTKGLLIRPLGAINASFYDSEAAMPNTAPSIHFNILDHRH